MPLRGPHRDRHLVGNLLIAEPAAELPEKFSFPVGQSGVLSHQRLTESSKSGRASCAKPHVVLRISSTRTLLVRVFTVEEIIDRSQFSMAALACGPTPSSRSGTKELHARAPWRLPPNG